LHHTPVEVVELRDRVSDALRGSAEPADAVQRGAAEAGRELALRDPVQVPQQMPGCRLGI
jgi:hypothetical protein